jgi:hypothetical protein
MIISSQQSYAARGIASLEAWVHKCDNYRFVLIIPAELRSNQASLSQPGNQSSSPHEVGEPLNLMQPHDMLVVAIL